ncbi:uncharacterized protein [Polyergus mexicanus]|uniref:uncharacterized protein n=1 Tax=Polyergus mexicanus TaxID=615972 RepID=UPI0038B41B8B
MALKKKKTPKLEKEQLYMLEILVDYLNLCPEKIINNEEHDFMIRVSFIDFTSVDIIAEQLAELKGKESKNKKRRFSDEYINYEGKTCLFVRTPSNLIRSIKSTPLSVEVYRNLREEDRNSRDNVGQVLICVATAFLPVYFCDRVTAAKDKIDGLPKPYTLMQVYTLTDEQGHPCGSISMYLRLSCFGSSIINHLTLHEKSFVFRGFPLGAKFRCASLSDENISDKKNRMKPDDNTFLLLSKILDPAYSKLHDGKDIDTDARFVLTKPESPPRISMDQPGFEKLTSAEKLNDRKYRSFIYEIYPDEPTCSCLPTNRSTHPMICRSGCVRSCCIGLRNPDILKNVPSFATDCVDNLHLESGAEQDVNFYDDIRMRGGEDTDNNHLNSNTVWNEEYMWYKNNNFKNRMKGGSDYGASAYAASEATSVIYEKSKETGTDSPYKSRPRITDGAKTAANCVCPGKNLSSWRTGTSTCTKKPCVGADCMIRAFKEAQEFVDSIGKVPGLVGLGLMDPSESPYFGRDIDKDYIVQETPSEKKRAYPVPTLPNLQCSAPCNTQISKPVVSVPSIAYSYLTSITTMTAVPGRTGVVREAIPSFPEATLVPISAKPKKKEDKKEEKLEKQKEKELEITLTAASDVDVGPCGEPKCKSRRKKAHSDRPVTTPQETVEESQKSSVPPSTISPSIGVKGVSRSIKRRHPKDKLPPGPGGDSNVTSDLRPIKVSKRVMRHIYSIGDVYPGTNYGHKNCIDPRLRVPANMGWLWNISTMIGTLKYPRIGWKPGAISRFLNELLKEAKGTSLLEDSRPRLTPSRTGLRRGKLYKSLSYISLKKEDEDEVEPPPTLHIHRKDGTYYVTMYPIRQETADAPQLEEPMKPLQFKIVRNKDDASVATSSTASDMEIEFSPPAAVNRYRRKPDVIHVDTQVRQQEILDAFTSTVDVPKKKEKKEKKGKKGKK